MLERTGLRAGRDFFLAFSPERVDPGNARVDHAQHAQDRRRAHARVHPLAAMDLYATAATRWCRSRSPEVAEMAKLLENIFRSVNIALVNELAMLCDRMGIDMWEVIDAAATKPFGFMPFWPGPGPRAATASRSTPSTSPGRPGSSTCTREFIELAGKVNSQMPDYCVTKVARALNSRRQGAQRRARAGAGRGLQGERRTTPARARRCASSSCCARRAPTWTTTTPTWPDCPARG